MTARDQGAGSGPVDADDARVVRNRKGCWGRGVRRVRHTVRRWGVQLKQGLDLGIHMEHVVLVVGQLRIIDIGSSAQR